MIFHFTEWFLIKLSSVLLKRYLQISLHKESFTTFESSSLAYFLFPCFDVLTDAIITVSSAFPSIKSEFRLYAVRVSYYYAIIYQYIKILNQI